MSLINAGYMGTRNCYNMGGFAIKLWNNKLKSLRNTTIEQDREEWENSPYVGIQHYKMQIPCIAYIYPETYEPLLWDGKKNPVSGGPVPIQPIVIADRNFIKYGLNGYYFNHINNRQEMFEWRVYNHDGGEHKQVGDGDLCPYR